MSRNGEVYEGEVYEGEVYEEIVRWGKRMADTSITSEKDHRLCRTCIVDPASRSAKKIIVTGRNSEELNALRPLGR